MMINPNPLELLTENGIRETPLETACVLVYEVGDLIKCLKLADWAGDTESYMGEIKCALSDSLIQLFIVCQEVGLSPADMYHLGYLRMRERLEVDPHEMAKKPLMIYVAGPLSGVDGQIGEEENVVRAVEVAETLHEMGHNPYIPHLTYYQNRILQELHSGYVPTYERWLAYDFEIIRRCDALFYMASSPGADKELEFALEIGKPVYKNFDEVPFVDNMGISKPESEQVSVECDGCPDIQAIFNQDIMEFQYAEGVAVVCSRCKKGKRDD